MKAKFRRERLSYLPPTLAIRKEVEEALEAAAKASREDVVRRIVADINERIRDVNRRGAEGPPSSVMPLDVDAVVAKWRDQQQRRVLVGTAGWTRAGGSVGGMSDITRPMALDAGFDPRSDVFNRLLKNRVIMLGTDVNDDMANQICAQLLYLEGEESSSDIWLYINSPGGSVTAGMAIYDTMQFISCDVATVCMGMAASMGQFLLTAGAAGKRYTLPNARIMMHQPLAGLRGQATDIAIQAEQLAYTKRRMAELTAHHSGQTLEQIQADSERDRWFTADQAKAYGLVDSVKTKRGELPN